MIARWKQSGVLLQDKKSSHISIWQAQRWGLWVKHGVGEWLVYKCGIGIGIVVILLLLLWRVDWVAQNAHGWWYYPEKRLLSSQTFMIGLLFAYIGLINLFLFTWSFSKRPLSTENEYFAVWYSRKVMVDTLILVSCYHYCKKTLFYSSWEKKIEHVLELSNVVLNLTFSVYCPCPRGD